MSETLFIASVPDLWWASDCLGGPSYEVLLKGGDDQKQQYLQDQYQLQKQQNDAILAKLNQTDPLVDEQRKQDMAILQYEDQAPGTIKDIRNAPGFADSISLYDQATQARADDTDIGAIGVGGAEANPLGLARISEDRAAKREERASGELANAWQNRVATARGEIPFVVGTDQQRLEAALSTTAGLTQSALGAYASFRPRPSWFSQLLSSAGGLAQAGATAFEYSG